MQRDLSRLSNEQFDLLIIGGGATGCFAARDAASAESVRILYGGSVKPANAAELLGLENVDGALVGGASLDAADFLAICEAL